MAQDVQALLLRIEASTELARRELVKVDAPLDGLGRNAEQAADRFSRSMNQIDKSAARVQNATRNLGFQIGDFTTQVSTGTPVFQAFGQQAGQAAGALSEFGGVVGRIGSFLSGPWGAILIAATTVLGGLAVKHLFAADAADKQAAAEGKLTAELTKRQKLALDNPILARRDREQAFIESLPRGSVIRQQREAEFARREGFNLGPVVGRNGELIFSGGDAPITVTASRVQPRSIEAAAPRASRATAKPAPEPGQFDRLGVLQLEQALARPVATGPNILEQAKIDLPPIVADFEKIQAAVGDISTQKFISAAAVQASEQFSQNLSRGLAQAIVQGQSLGDALVNSIKAAAAELISSGLLRLLSGGGEGGGNGGILGKLFGGFFATGGRPPMGKVSVVGERGPELFVPSVPGEVIPNYKLASIGRGGGGNGMVQVSLDQGLVATVVQGAVQVADARGAERLRQARRPRMMASPGA